MIKNKKVAISLGVVCLLLVIAIFTQMKTVNNMENSVGTTLFLVNKKNIIDYMSNWKKQKKALKR